MSKTPDPIELKGSLHTLTSLRLLSADPEVVANAVRRRVEQAPDFLSHAPVVLDLGLMMELPDLSALAKGVRGAGMIPVGVSGNLEGLADAAHAAGLALISKRERRPAKGETAEITQHPGSERASPKPGGGAAKVVHQTVRSGQQVYARGGDLVILASVNPDAEVLADGHIHVYGSLRGKALAGVQGDTGARIFAQKLDPQLIAVAGNYRAGADLDGRLRQTAAQAWLDGDVLHVDPL
ncbi:MAG: septum site-determining protein MinC [Gammaproteobacteria bacterium]